MFLDLYQHPGKSNYYQSSLHHKKKKGLKLFYVAISVHLNSYFSLLIALVNVALYLNFT